MVDRSKGITTDPKEYTILYYVRERMDEPYKFYASCCDVSVLARLDTELRKQAGVQAKRLSSFALLRKAGRKVSPTLTGPGSDAFYIPLYVDRDSETSGAAIGR